MCLLASLYGNSLLTILNVITTSLTEINWRFIVLCIYCLVFSVTVDELHPSLLPSICSQGFVLVYEIPSKASFDLLVALRLKIAAKNKDVSSPCVHPVCALHLLP